MIAREHAGLTPGQREWLRVNAYLNANRHDLGIRAAQLYPARARLAGAPLLAAPSWRPAAPVPLADIRLEFRPGVPRGGAGHVDVAGLAPELLPERPDGTRYRRHTDVIADLAPPAIFENRLTYRLIAADLAGEDPRLTFSRGRFFDAVDVGGAVAHEYAAARLAGAGGRPARQRLRAAIGDPGVLLARSAAMAISTLTLRHDRAAGTATFPLHMRDPARVAHAGGLVQVLPVGIFQPSGEAPWNEANDFDLWRGMLREFAEEMLGADEDHGSETAPIDYGRWPFARRMTAGRDDGRIRLYCLGLGADPLTLAVDLLTVAVFDAALYDELFATPVGAFAEGSVLPPRAFDEATVAELAAGQPVQAAGAALLTLAIAHRDVLLGALPENGFVVRWPRVQDARHAVSGVDLLAVCVNADGDAGNRVPSSGRINKFGQPVLGHYGGIFTTRARAIPAGAVARPRAWCPSRARGTPRSRRAAGQRPSPPRRCIAT